VEKVRQGIGGVMSQRKRKSANPDDQRMNINIKEEYEIYFWSMRFDCTRKELEAAVRKVGAMASKVEKELHGR
jgi:hypothetical protein